MLGTPSAKHDAIGKVKGTQLKVSVKEAPRGGKATDYMVRFLAGVFDVTNKDIQVVSGRFSVNKQFRIKNPKSLPTVIFRVDTKDETRQEQKEIDHASSKRGAHSKKGKTKAKDL